VPRRIEVFFEQSYGAWMRGYIPNPAAFAVLTKMFDAATLSIVFDLESAQFCAS
jgi:hypothetical protein